MRLKQVDELERVIWLRSVITHVIIARTHLKLDYHK